MSSKIFSDEKKYFFLIICTIKSLIIMLTKTKAYVKSYDGQTKMDVFFDF